ncbi:hypothetical protein AB4225_29470 [Streptomyces sp. 2RAF24]|uniref:hypothetical protein n=1 Tax=Streptomyces sp. 2RAF24 TaxID=3232997 RepID=UPI003F969B8E
MTWRIQPLAIGVTLVALCTACSGGSDEGAPGNTSPTSFTKLGRLDSIHLPDDPFSEVDDEGAAHPLGEVSKGKYRLIPYVQQDSCGLLVLNTTPSGRPLISLLSKWPKNSGEGSQIYPAGPYNQASGAEPGKGGAWAQISCAEQSMVVRFTSRATDPPSRPQGNIALLDTTKTPKELVFVVGSKSAQSTVLPQVAD